MSIAIVFYGVNRALAFTLCKWHRVLLIELSATRITAQQTVEEA
ncbi:hypothetical protein [Spartinivicinus marinus]|nr:hypothetical protein [Spartinivicinus marinus]MCX4024895.1 hypothetical protein [Spartinivicinus marinus]